MSDVLTIEVPTTDLYTRAELKEKAEAYIKQLVQNSKKDYAEYFGSLEIKKNPLALQKEMRNEW